MKRPYRIISLALLCGTLAGGCALSPSVREDADQARTREYLEQADQFLERGLLDSALAAFGLALEENARVTEAHMGMGAIYRERGDYELASRAYKRATTTDPTNYDAHYYLGLMRQLLGDVDQAIRAYLQALAIRPDSVEANRDLAAAYLQSGRSGDALPYALRATRLNPGSQTAWTNLAAAYSLLGRHEEAVNAYRQAAELGELPREVLLGFADANLQLGRYERAITLLERLLRQEPSATAHERLGYALFKQRRFDESLAQYRRALAINPDETAALNGLGAVLMTNYIQGNRSEEALRDEAVESWRRSLRIRPTQPRIADLLSRYSRL